MVRSGSDNSYGVYLAQLLFITALGWLGWRHLNGYLPWPLVSVITVVLVFVSCIGLTELLARTPLAKPLTGRTRVPWRTAKALVTEIGPHLVEQPAAKVSNQERASAPSDAPATAAAMAAAIVR